MNKTIQTKRTRTSGPSYRVLYAKTGRSRRLSAATATVDPHVDLESDVANVGIGKALLVILVLHVCAIAAIYAHSKFFSNDSDGSEASAPLAVTAPSEVQAPVVEQPKPQVQPAAAAVTPAPAEATPVDRSMSRYIVVTGDTYNRIASVRNVDESALRALNDNRPLRAGVVLDLPAVLSSRPVAINPTPSVAEQPEVHAPRVPEVAVRDTEKKYARAVEVEEDSAPQAVVVKPKIKRSVAEASTLSDSGQRYKVQSGDTVWRIANRYKVSRANLLKINGLTDPRKLRVGVEIKIPAN
ncbi:LysM peptidoglycan-binding domain-containing protein [Verrucomicrobiaceae bacterium 5K15]|uniref:LysM peptidoglycan-binding domain-containing protein n=1 Tax=Oceaniferula flava TaxID=2800421 RepID=A0AAE2VCQ6_9BACT|nr:LysM peptidoglycan-binding domain-containing protein [Oceaniferula flavus]MBK1853559.1 LysM peptidoglycan-binding domain-containing protein [Oceaniferula flavus]MBM1134864.1 LysM peptidoglycan-binding domain-containing protein [Oceaniferula flavus]